MESVLINMGKKALSRTTTLWEKGFDASLTGSFTRSLREAYQESATGRLLNRDLIGQSYSYTLLQTMAANIEKLLKLPAGSEARWRGAFTYGILLASAILTVLAFLFLPWPQALGATGAIFLAVAVLYRTEAGLYAAALILPFVPFKVLLLLALLTLASFLLKAFNGSRSFRFHLTPIMVPLLLFYLVMLYATVTSVSFSTSASEFLIPVTGLIYLFVMVNVLDRREKLDYFLYCLALSGIITAGYAIYQYYTGASNIEVRKEWIDLVKNPEIRNRAFGVFENPNLLAQYLVLLTTLSLGGIFGAARRGHQIFFALTAALSAFCLVLTYSRGGWVAFVAALAVFTLFKNKLLMQALPVAGIVAYSFMPNAIIQRLSTITSLKDTSNAYRLDTYQSTLSLIKAHWETGVGLGRLAFARVYHTHMINSNVVPHSHNLYLQIISEFGILGLAVFIWLFLGIFRLGLRLRTAGTTYIRDLNAGVMGALSGFFVHSTVDYFLWYYKLGILLWLLVAVVLVLERLTSQQISPERNG